MANKESSNNNFSYFKVIIRFVLYVGILAAVIFTTAGKVNYWQGWAFCLITILGIFITLILFSGKTDLIKERMKPGPGIKWWDKILMSIFIPINISVVIIGCLDGGRYNWTGTLPIYAYIIGYTVYIMAYSIMIYSMYINSFFSSVVRIQEDRGHQVIDSGPYRFVRHPGYVGGILLLLSLPLVLGSLWALAPASISIILIVIRTYLEDTTLKKELPGYIEYTTKTNYRLLPGIW